MSLDKILIDIMDLLLENGKNIDYIEQVLCELNFNMLSVKSLFEFIQSWMKKGRMEARLICNKWIQFVFHPFHVISYKDFRFFFLPSKNSDCWRDILEYQRNINSVKSQIIFAFMLCNKLIFN
jgi:hypothetical protein